MFDNYLVRAALAGVGLALAAGPLGCFVVWRRMAYFGDATAHAAILGVALALAASVPVFAGVLVVSLAMALVVSTLHNQSRGMDTLLGVMSHAALALGLVAISFLPSVRVDVMAYLTGDILAVGKGDLALIWAGGALVLGLLFWRWTPLLTATLNVELAYASGIDPKREQLVLTLALAVVVAVALKVVGALLIAAMLIIPAASARALARTPETMAAIAAGIGVVAALGGVQASIWFDTPTGPMIVSTAALAFGVVTGAVAVLKRVRAGGGESR